MLTKVMFRVRESLSSAHLGEQLAPRAQSTRQRNYGTTQKARAVNPSMFGLAIGGVGALGLHWYALIQRLVH